MDKNNHHFFTVIPNVEERRYSQVPTLSIALLYALLVVIACLICSVMIILVSFLHIDLARDWRHQGQGHDVTRDQLQDCTNPALYMELGYNLGLQGPNLTTEDLYKVFIRVMMSKEQHMDSPAQRVEDGCKNILLEAYAIGVKNSEASANEISSWLRNF